MEESVSSKNYAADLSTKDIRKTDNLIPIKSNIMDMISCSKKFRTELGISLNHQLGRLILTPLRLVFLGVAECFGSTRDLTQVRMREAHVEELDKARHYCLYFFLLCIVSAWSPHLLISPRKCNLVIILLFVSRELFEF